MYVNHGINKDAFEILMRPMKAREDFQDFLEAREAHFVRELEKWGFKQPKAASEDVNELLDD